MRRKLGPSGTIYYYEWNDIDTDWEKWLHLKGHWPTASWDGNGGWEWLTPAETKIKAACAAATGPRQWLLLGNELTLAAGCSSSYNERITKARTQAQMFKQAHDWAKAANPNMRVVWGGWTIDIPDWGASRLDGLESIALVAEQHNSLYGYYPQSQGVHFHAYHTYPTDKEYERQLRGAVQLIGQHWGKQHIILSEWGHTTDYTRMRAAMDVVQSIHDLFFAVFWYKSCCWQGWRYDCRTSLFNHCIDSGGSHGLTNIGLHYKTLRLS